MRKRDHKELGRYVRAIADLMELRDWTIQVDIRQPDTPDRADGAEWGASCRPIAGRKLATVTLHPCVRDDSREDLRQTVVHELIHCHFFGVWDTARQDLLGPLAQQTYDVLIAGLERNMEYGVDALADALAPHMPLIEWPNRGDSRGRR